MTERGELDRLYSHRFSDAEVAQKLAMWAEITRFLGRWIPPDGAIVDIASDLGYFVRNARGRELWATDIRDLANEFEPPIRFVQVDGLALADSLPRGHFDVAFMSNYLEHLPSTTAVIRQFEQVFEILKPGGRVIVLQPNIRFVGGAYWNFLDHHVALTDHSLAEAAVLTGFRVDVLIPRLLTYTTKSRLPQSPSLVKAYLRFPPAWRLLGKQALMVASRPPA